MLTLVGMGVFPGDMTQSARSAMETADALFLQTARCRQAALFPQAQFLDDLYDAAEDFDTLAEAVCTAVLARAQAETVVFALPGEAGGQPLVMRMAAEAAARGVAVRALRGVSFAQRALPPQLPAPVLALYAQQARGDADATVAVMEIDSRLRAGEAKLALLRAYDETHEILFATAGESEYSHKKIPLYALDRQSVYAADTVAIVPPAPLAARTRFDAEAVAALLRRLREPDGCPWDREQTHASIRQNMIEEAYEAYDAIEQRDDAALEEELGDVLMQVAFHAAMAEERGAFGFDDVTSGIGQKLVRRHPHVFADAKAEDAGAVVLVWDAVKKQEKPGTAGAELAAVPRHFPALMRAEKIQRRARKVGFDWDEAGEALKKVDEELAELKEELAKHGAVEEELGDLLFAVANTARLLGLDSERALHAACVKFTQRFCRMEALAGERGRDLPSMTLKEMDELWECAKKSQRAAKNHPPKQETP